MKYYLIITIRVSERIINIIALFIFEKYDEGRESFDGPSLLFVSLTQMRDWLIHSSTIQGSCLSISKQTKQYN